MSSNKKIAVLITCHNRKKKTMSCLGALFTARVPDKSVLDVFLVDDGSTDGTGKAVKKLYPNVNVIQGTGNLYWNRGMHLAWKTASETGIYDYYLWLNDDVQIFENALQEILDIAVQKEAIVCGTMQSRINNNITYGGSDEKGKLIPPSGKPLECHYFNGNLVLVPSKIFEAVGNLDPVFSHAIGDYDYALRAKLAGFKNYIASGYCGFCESNPSLPKWCRPEVGLNERINSLYSPLGNSQPISYFKYIKRHRGLLSACRSFLSIHTRVFFPKLWK